VLWEVGQDGTWWRLAVVHITVDEERDIENIAFDDTPDAVERAISEAPEATLPEGATWSEWEDGASPEA
jgi:hypothetical protein